MQPARGTRHITNSLLLQLLWASDRSDGACGTGLPSCLCSSSTQQGGSQGGTCSQCLPAGHGLHLLTTHRTAQQGDEICVLCNTADAKNAAPTIGPSVCAAGAIHPWPPTTSGALLSNHHVVCWRSKEIGMQTHLGRGFGSLDADGRHAADHRADGTPRD